MWTPATLYHLGIAGSEEIILLHALGIITKFTGSLLDFDNGGKI